MPHRKHLTGLGRLRAALSCVVAVVLLTVPVTCDAASVPHSIFVDPHHHVGTDSGSSAGMHHHEHHPAAPSREVDEEHGTDLASLNHTSGSLFLVSSAMMPSVWTPTTAIHRSIVRIDIDLPPVAPAMAPEPPPPRALPPVTIARELPVSGN